MKFDICFKSGKRVEVKVWKTRQEYEAALSGAGKDELAGSYACFKASPVRVNSRKVGEIHLVEGNFGAGVVAHECLHAVFHWLNMLPTGTELDDEAICEGLGQLVSEFWIKLYAKTKEGRIVPLAAGS
jgi:hypothetical protein